MGKKGNIFVSINKQSRIVTFIYKLIDKIKSKILLRLAPILNNQVYMKKCNTIIDLFFTWLVLSLACYGYGWHYPFMLGFSIVVTLITFLKMWEKVVIEVKKK